MAEQTLVRLVAIHATAETAAPSVPNKGANVASWTGWSTFGSVDFQSDDGDLEDIKLPEWMYKSVPMQAPRAGAPKGAILMQNGAGEWEFTLAESTEAALTLASNIGVTSHVGTAATSITYRTVVIEMEGLNYLYMPKCEVIAAKKIGDNTKQYEGQSFRVVPHGTTTIPGGMKQVWYQAA